MTVRGGIASSILLVAALAPVEARAQPTASAVAAEELFHEGRELMARGQFAEACKKLDASQKLGPAVGTLFSLGQCYEGQGRLASAWFAFHAAVALAGQLDDKRGTLAQGRADALEPKLARLVIRLPASGGVGEVAVDGDRIVPDAVGTPLPVDPGTHRIDAKSTVPWHREVEVPANGATIEVDIPEPPPLLPPPTEVPSPPKKPDRHELAHTLGIGMIAGGSAVVATGAVFGMQAIVKGRDANRACTTGLACADASAVHENDVAKTYADVSTVLFPVGIAVGAVGTYFLWTSRTTVEPVVSPTSARIDVRWSW